MESKQIAGVETEVEPTEESGGDPLPVEEIVGCQNPKIIEWEELQQELARLWSLSSALKNAKERKNSLALRLESVIEVRQKYLQQSNELDDMRRKVEARKLMVGDMGMQIKETMEDAKSKSEQLGTALRSLLVAAKKVCAANQQLEVSGILAELLLMLSRASTQSSAPSMLRTPPPGSSLSILGQQLTAIPLKKMSFFSDKKEIQKSAIVLGYVAHAVMLIASYLNVHLRYPVRLGGSHSYIHDYAPSVETTSSDSVVSPLVGATTKPAEFPLFLEGQDPTRAAYAIFLLNKDLEQILNYFGAESLGPRHLLANLKEVMRIVLAQEFLDK
ncbi:hypothetical protein AXF42_Ash012463 [Apostasia shenzhenica]|uniref:UV radiation resistance-associated gene protein n=1 Tax=Apostasia shenzhenica TaxID=1088818 RepID=A0A2I0AQV3_9ASPA|nr:hypothetical protein AXF42_Ash012463 [Apostasia shenzhenica]